MTSSALRQRAPASAMLDPKIVWPAFGQAFVKLDPRLMVRNPVMFVVETVALLTTVLFIRDLFTGAGQLGFAFQIILWLWITVIFANFAEAVAEGRGKAQAAALRETREKLFAKLITDEARNIYLYPHQRAGAVIRPSGAGRGRGPDPVRRRGGGRYRLGQ
jgi:K+-transporting ATPase ATPase B chain